MAKTLKTSVSVVLTDEDQQKTSRFMDNMIMHEPISHESGEANLPGSTVDHELASNINQMIIFSDSPFKIKIGNTTNPEHSNMKFFAYDGESKDIFVSNDGTDSITLTFASAKY